MRFICSPAKAARRICLGRFLSRYLLVVLTFGAGDPCRRAGSQGRFQVLRFNSHCPAANEGSSTSRFQSPPHRVLNARLSACACAIPDYDKRWIHGPERCAAGAPNGYGLYDMCENVHEWCSDWYGRDYYATSPELNPRGPESSSRRVSRGGSWRHQVRISRCAARSSIVPLSSPVWHRGAVREGSRVARRLSNFFVGVRPEPAISAAISARNFTR